LRQIYNEYAYIQKIKNAEKNDFQAEKFSKNAVFAKRVFFAGKIKKEFGRILEKIINYLTK